MHREATVLRMIFGDATILLTIRPPEDWIASVERYMVANALTGEINRTWSDWDRHIDLWRQYFTEVHTLELGEPDYLESLATILGVAPFEDIDMRPVFAGPRGWRYAGLKALNRITGVNHYLEGRRPHAWPRRWLNGRT